MKKFLAILHARNMEFIRDRSSLGWNILFPLLLVLAFAVVFSGDEKPLYKVGVLGDPARLSARDSVFLSTRYIQFIPVTDLDKGIDKVEHFQLDMLVDVREGRRYWVNGTSPGGYLLEHILGKNFLVVTRRQEIKLPHIGDQIGFVPRLQVDVEITLTEIEPAAEVQSARKLQRIEFGWHDRARWLRPQQRAR